MDETWKHLWGILHSWNKDIPTARGQQHRKSHRHVQDSSDRQSEAQGGNGGKSLGLSWGTRKRSPETETTRTEAHRKKKRHPGQQLLGPTFFPTRKSDSNNQGHKQGADNPFIKTRHSQRTHSPIPVAEGRSSGCLMGETVVIISSCH